MHANMHHQILIVGGGTAGITVAARPWCLGPTAGVSERTIRTMNGDHSR